MRISAKARTIEPNRYVERVNRAIDYVISRLASPLRLAQVARAAQLSPFHFHRVFQALVGETLASFVKRLRLERALVRMAHRPASLTAIALECGFSSSSDFSRCFKKRFGVPPRSFDMHTWRETHNADIEAAAAAPAARERLLRLPAGQNPDGFRVTLRELPARTVSYIRVLNPYRGDAVPRAARRLIAWAQRRGLAAGQWLGYQWDHPEFVALEDCQYHVGVETPAPCAGGEVGTFRFPAMTVAEVTLRGGIDLELRALQWLYGTWLPRSRYVPDDQPCFEAWLGLPFAHGMEHFELRAQLPVRRD